MTTTRAVVLAVAAVAGSGTVAYLGVTSHEEPHAVVQDAAPVAHAAACENTADDDRDGVLDCVDRCAFTPDGTAVDAIGCPLPPSAPTIPKRGKVRR